MSAEFENYSILIVEDNAYIRRLLYSVVRQFGFQRIFDVASYKEAVGLLEKMRFNPQKIGVSAIDLALIDRKLPRPHSGYDLVRWIRNDEKSPDSMMRLMMVSAYFDYDNWEDARKAGVHSSLIKPFSTKSIHEHIFSAINDTRWFVKTRDYFGPDRRHQDIEPPDGIEQRNPDIPESRKGAKMIRQKDLRGRLNAEKKTEAAELERMEVEIMRKSDDELYGQLGELLASLRTNYAALINAQDQGERKRILAGITRDCAEIRSHGSIFSFPMIARVGRSLDRISRLPNIQENKKALRIIDAIVKVATIVHMKRIEGPGGKLGVELTAALDRAISQIAQATNVSVETI